jgi:hypothetical protein
MFPDGCRARQVGRGGTGVSALAIVRSLVLASILVCACHDPSTSADREPGEADDPRLRYPLVVFTFAQRDVKPVVDRARFRFTGRAAYTT